MAAVAMNSIVATVMQASFSAVGSTHMSSGKDDFQSVLDSKSQNTETVVKSSKIDSANKQSGPKDIQETMSPKPKAKVTKKDQETSDDSVSDVAEDVIKKMAKLMNVSEDEIKEALEDVSLESLLSGEGIMTLFMNLFNMESPMELLTDANLSEMYKEVEAIISDAFEGIQSSLTDTELDQSILALLKTESNSKTVTETPVTQSETDVSNMNQTQDETMEVDAYSEGSGAHDSGQSSEGDGNSGFMNEFTGVLDQVVTEKVTTIQVGGFEQVITQQVTATDVLDQIVTQMRVVASNDVQTISLQLQPENLGRVAFSVSQENGVLTGSFVAENNAVKEAIEANLATLRTTLSDQGIKVDDIKVVVGNTSEMFNQQDQQQHFQNQQQSKKQRRVIRIESVNGPKDDVPEEENLLQDIEDHSVEFSA